MNIRNGFTLIELAIALMVIGLLIGGVLKGQELIENARITRSIKDITDYNTAIMIFRNTYNALPGDIRNASTRLPNCTNYPCNNTVGVGTGFMDTTNPIKRANFWRHLDRAKLITNINDTGNHNTTSSLNTFGGHSAVDHNNTDILPAASDPSYNILYFFDPSVGTNLISPVRLGAIDRKTDDGKPLSGFVRLRGLYEDASPSVSTACRDAVTGDYAISPNMPCASMIIMDGMN